MALAYHRIIILRKGILSNAAGPSAPDYGRGGQKRPSHCRLPVLVKWGFEAEPFDDPVKALQRFKENPSAFSVVLSDVRMPSMDGIHFTKEVLKIRPATKVVMMTAFEQDGYVYSNLPMIKKEDVLKKPFRFAEICTAVKKATGVAI